MNASPVLRRFAYCDQEGNIAIVTESWVEAAELPGYRRVEVPFTVTDESHWISPAGDPVAYTPAQRQAKATVPPHPAHWSNQAMAWVDDRSLSEVREDQWRQIKAAREAAEWGGFDTPFGRFDSDPASQTKIIGAAQLASIALAQGAPFNIEWTLQDNTRVSLDAAQMIAVGAALANHVNAIHQRGRQLRAQIEAAATLADLESITWTL